MIKVTFLKDSENLTGFTVEGHSGYASQGSDIVCSAVSSAAYLAANTVAEIIGDTAQADVGEGYMSFEVTSPGKESLAVLRGLELHLTELSKDYPGNITVNYGGVNNA